MSETNEKRLSDTLNDMLVTDKDLPITEQDLVHALELNDLKLVPKSSGSEEVIRIVMTDPLPEEEELEEGMIPWGHDTA